MPRLSDEGTHNKVYDVRLPVESTGRCKNALRCENTDVTLGNGYCMDCYDKGIDSRTGRLSKADSEKRRLKTIDLRNQGLTYDAIGKRLGISRNTAFSYIHRYTHRNKNKAGK